MSATNVLKKIFCGIFALGLVFGALNVIAATPDCPDCPADKDGSIFPGGSCENCGSATVEVEDKDGSIFPGGSCDRCSASRKSDKKVRIVDGPRQRVCESCPQPEFRTRNYVFAQPRYKSDAANRNCCDLAPFALTYVDFKLNNQEGYNPYSGHVGNYRFRIFGCRRASKKAFLNHGRVIQKDMAFNQVFSKAADKCYKVMEIPTDVCLADTNVKLPEYALTAEVTNFFMNVCDEYDWDKAKKANKRNGTAEMTITWRLMNLSQSKVYWKGVTTGYAEVENGVYEGEVKLAEEAFADAAARLSSLPGFEEQLKMRISAEEIAQERAALVAFDEKFNPGKCNFAKEVEYTHSCDYAPQPQCPAVPRPMCPCAVQQPCVCTQPVCSCPPVNCPCAPAKPKVEEFVDVKTQTTTVEKKFITTTRVETPAPVCRQVCVPVCPKKKTVTTTTTTVTTVEEEGCPVQCSQKCEQPKCRKVCTETCEEGRKECSTECVEDCTEKTIVEEPVKVVETVVSVPVIEENGGVEVENKSIASQIEEDGGVTDSYRVYENCIDEKGDVISDGSCTVIDDNWVDLDGYTVDSKLCIVDRPPYSELSPENMLKIRGAVVDIVNAKGSEGKGLIISDSFILTSAGLVNKLNNTYDVKTMNGETLKAKAVRVNPSKNIALMHLDRPVAYTPLSLNLELPAIDQEGFIALGNEGEGSKNYMDDNGKIYGYRYSDSLGTEIIVDTLVQKVSTGSVLIDKLGTVNGISNSGKQTEDGMDLFIPTETALRSVGLTICEKLYEKKSPWEKTVYKPVTEKIKQETKAPEAMAKGDRK
ncbi:MAG: hypothetical protein NC218_07880 [Acetobacter sp.]|nr:hypothetical protein [Acetobacter sp.]